MSDKREAIVNVIKGILCLLLVAIILFAAAGFGSMLRGEIRCWFWQQYPITCKHYGVVNAILEILCFYFPTYSLGFLFPLGIMSILNGAYARNQHSFGKSVPDIHSMRRAAILVSIGFWILSMASLKALLAFIRLIPMQDFLRLVSTPQDEDLPYAPEFWNNTLFLILVIVGTAVIYKGFTKLRAERAKTLITVDSNAVVKCECPQCGHKYTFPADDLQRGRAFIKRDE